MITIKQNLIEFLISKSIEIRNDNFIYLKDYIKDWRKFKIISKNVWEFIGFIPEYKLIEEIKNKENTFIYDNENKVNI